MDCSAVEASVCFPGAGSRVSRFDSVDRKRKDDVSDEELVERSLRGEEDAFRHLYERYRKPVYAAVYRVVRDPDEAQDAAQETFFAAHRFLATWSPQRARFVSWICRIATNHAIDRWRKRRRCRELSLTEISKTRSESRFFWFSTAELMSRGIEISEGVREIRRCMEDLPRLHNRVVFLRYCEGLKLREIAEKEGCKIGTVKSVLHRATNAIRLRLRRQESGVWRQEKAKAGIQDSEFRKGIRRGTVEQDSPERNCA